MIFGLCLAKYISLKLVFLARFYFSNVALGSPRAVSVAHAVSGGRCSPPGLCVHV